MSPLSSLHRRDPFLFPAALTLVLLFALCPRVFAAEPDAGAGDALNRIRQIQSTGGPAAALAELDQLLAKLRPEQRLVAWRVEFPTSVRRAEGAWLIGDRLLVATLYAAILQFDVRTGRRLPDIGVPSYEPDKAPCWVEAADAAGREAIMLSGTSVQRVELDTGKVLKTVAGQFDRRIAPIACADGFIAVPGFRADKLDRWTWDGKQAWEADLPGYLMCHAAESATTLVVQTRQGSYGGQTTTAIDIKTGQQLWSMRTDAYGEGVAFGDDARFVVEADEWLSPQQTKGQLICRDPRSGDVLWQYEQPGGIAHRPLVDSAGRRVLALFKPARLICFDDQNGKVVWSTDLPANPAAGGASPHDPQRRVMQLQGTGLSRSLVVMDDRHIAYILDPSTGKIRLSVPTASEYDVVFNRYEHRPFAAPWLHGDLFVVAGSKHVAAYPAARVLAGQKPLELSARMLRARLLLQLNQAEAARTQLQQLQASCPETPEVLEALAELYGPKSPMKDPQAELMMRLRRLHTTGEQTDARLAEQFGLVRRIPVGGGPSRPLLVGNVLYVASRAGKILSFDAETLRSLREYDMGVPVNSDLAFFDNAGGLIVFGTENRHTAAVSTDLQLRFDLPSCSSVEHYALGEVLVRAWPSIPAVSLAVLDIKTGQFGPEMQINRWPMQGYIYRGRLYFLQNGGASVSFDGQQVVNHPPLLQLRDFGVQRIDDARLAVNTLGTEPVAFGAGGVFAVDEFLRANRKLLASDTYVQSAALNQGALALVQPKDRQWLLEAWTADGARKLPLSYAMRPYGFYMDMDRMPSVVPLGGGFLFVGGELVYVEPDKQSPVWRFCPDDPRSIGSATFRLPVVRGQTMFITHEDGDLLVFDLQRVLPPQAGRPGQ